LPDALLQPWLEKILVAGHFENLSPSCRDFKKFEPTHYFMYRRGISRLMAADVSKNQIEQALPEKNRVEDATKRIWRWLDESPGHQRRPRHWGFVRAHGPAGTRAVYYGMFFDLLVDPKTRPKRSRFTSIPEKFGFRNGPERIARYAFLQQRQNRGDEAIETIQ